MKTQVVLIISLLCFLPIIWVTSFATVPTLASIDSSSSNLTSAGTSLTVTLSTNYAKDLVILFIYSFNTSMPVSSVSDSAALTWFKLSGPSSINNFEVYVYYAISTSNNPLSNDVITVTLSGTKSTAIGLVVDGITGSQLSSPFDGNVLVTTGNSNSAIENMQTIFANDLILGFLANGQTTTFTPTTGFIQYQVGHTSQQYFEAIQQSNAPAGIYSVGGTLSGTFNWIVEGLAIQSINQTPANGSPSPITQGMDFYFWLVLGIIDFALTFVGLIAILGEGEPKVWGLVLIIVAAPLSFFLAINAYNLIYINSLGQAVPYGGVWPFAFVYWGVAGLDMLFFFIGIVKMLNIKRSFAGKLKRFMD